MLFYRAALPLSSRILAYASGIIRRHRSATGSRWRKLNAGRQALLMPVYLRKGETFAKLAAGFGVGTTTAWRYVNRPSPSWRRGRRSSIRPSGTRLGTARQCRGGRRPHPDRPGRRGPSVLLGKAQEARMNLQVIASPAGDILWVSEPLPATRAPRMRKSRTTENKPESQKQQQGACEATLTRRASECPAQGLAPPPYAPLLSLTRRPARQGHPHIEDPRGKRRMKKDQSPAASPSPTALRRSGGGPRSGSQPDACQGQHSTMKVA
jgi:hypothetical protein